MVASARVIESADWIDQLRLKWTNLESEGGVQSPFQTLDWLEPWWNLFGGTKRPHIYTLREGKDLVGIMPLTLSRGPWRTVRTMGTGVSDYLQPVVMPGYERQFAEMLAGHLESLKSIDLVDLHQIREDLELARIFTVRASDQASCLVLDLPDRYDDYVSCLSKSLRYEVRRLDRPGQAKRLTLATASNAEESLAYLDIFFKLHQTRWKQRALPGAFFSSKVRHLHQAFVQSAVRNDHLRLTVLHVDGVAAGALYAMKTGDTFFFYQSGFDPQQRSHSPGTVLVAHAIQMAIEEGAKKFDFLRGDEPYKRRWKPQRIMSNKRILMAKTPILGEVGEGINRAGSRVELKLRARLEGRALLS